jgi:hypothetical protein
MTMAYCSISDIEREIGTEFTPDTHPNMEEVEGAIKRVSSEIDGVLQATGYPLPVTNVDALDLLKGYTKFAVAAQSFHAGVYADQEPARVDYWRKTYDDFIARLRRGDQQLPGETAESGPQAGFSVATQRVDGYSEGNAFLLSQGPFLRRRWG